MKDLKECPFCGGEAKKGTHYSPAGYEIKFIACTRCHCQTKEYDIFTENKVLAEEWNKRTIGTDIKEIVVKEFLDKLLDHEVKKWTDRMEFGITWADLEMVAKQMKEK